MSYKIVVDASCDIEDTYIDYVHVLPMSYSLDDTFKVCDGKQNDEELAEFYDNQKKGDVTKTTQITPFLYEQYFNELLNDCDSLLYISLSSGLSSTYQSALIAANIICNDTDKQIKVLDSLSASGGIGILAARAIRNRESGMSLDDNYEDLVSLRGRLHHFFMVDDLMYLKRGGRINAATAIIGSAIGIKPILIIDKQGKLETVEKKKGSIAAVNYIFDGFMETVDKDGDDTFYIIDSNNKKMSDVILTKMNESLPEKKVCQKTLTPIIGAHTGPGLAAIIFVSKE